MKRISGRLVLAFLLVSWATPAAASTPDSALSQHVIVISIDGLRPDAIEAFELRTLQELMRRGSFTLEASTILPSKTLPSHASMITGRPPEVHGLTFNSARPENGLVAVATMFEMARHDGRHVAAFYSKAKLRHLDRPDSYDYRQAPSFNADNWMATRTVPDAIRYLRHHRPNLLFVHIGEPDYAGHGAGWMGFFYGLSVRRADAAVERLVEAAEAEYGAGNFTVLVTADHGGHGRGHGSDDPQDVLIPWIAYGKGIRVDGRPTGVRTMDTAATALWLLGVPLFERIEGRPVHDVFDMPVPIVVDGS